MGAAQEEVEVCRQETEAVDLDFSASNLPRQPRLEKADLLP